MTTTEDHASLPAAIAAGATTAGAVIRAERAATVRRGLVRPRRDHRERRQDQHRRGTAVLGAYARPIRDLVTGRVRAYHARLRRFDDTDWRGYARFLDLAFALAVGQHFQPGQDRVPVIRFVAAARATYHPGGANLDPNLAECLISAALGERRRPPVTPACVAALTLLLVALLREDGRTDLDGFLRLAEDLDRTDDPTRDAPL
ncbi:hypothetical protein O7627_19430 [Solwaraspora sp. WMMD1047]|uniref:hypothetical protein n=1 Tax=Solwaraspora sp. WMMD1047 TaxID=3016102 RepID=UPI002415F71B|nr:hypothetical protein [Solwaraspora sp. WMMD1047]MDG4831473.1 hypothetical protein [Solwaraspora sp. WMMD1047]